MFTPVLLLIHFICLEMWFLGAHSYGVELALVDSLHGQHGFNGLHFEVQTQPVDNWSELTCQHYF